MPEGPETEVVRRSLVTPLHGRIITDTFSSELALRGVVLSQRMLASLVGATVGKIERLGKRLGLPLTLKDGREHRLLIQLGMTGRLILQSRHAPRPLHTHLVLSLDDDVLLYADPRRFGSVVLDTSATWPPADLGPDLLSLNRTGPQQKVRHALLRTRRRLKDALLDQRVIAGVGNIYACEALFVAGIDPRTRGSDAAHRIDRLLTAVVEEARRGIKNGGTTFRDFVDGRGKRGHHQDHLRVFLRQGKPCLRCQHPIERLVLGQRSTFFCKHCQA